MSFWFIVHTNGVTDNVGSTTLSYLSIIVDVKQKFRICADYVTLGMEVLLCTFLTIYYISKNLLKPLSKCRDPEWNSVSASISVRTRPYTNQRCIALITSFNNG